MAAQARARVRGVRDRVCLRGLVTPPLATHPAPRLADSTAVVGAVGAPVALVRARIRVRVRDRVRVRVRVTSVLSWKQSPSP